MEADIATSLAKFSVDLYKQLRASAVESHGNMFYSPFSISAGLSMVLAGARNQTAKQLSDALHVKDDQSHHRQFSKFLTEQLPGYAPDVILSVANGMYCDIKFPVQKEFLDFLQKNYGASIQTVDFKSDAEKVTLEINAWVEQVTASKITDVIAPGTLSSATLLLLVNAIYFKGLWEYPFSVTSTDWRDFHVDSKNKKTVQMMFQTDGFCLVKNKELKVTALQMPYKGLKTSMVILLPDDVEGLSFVEEKLTVDNLSSLVRGIASVSRIFVELYLPKFKLEETITLMDTLQSLGIKDLFSANSDLSAICETGKLAVTKVLHKAFVEVNEEGTEAVGALTDQIEQCDMILKTQRFLVDHPFMFLIRSHNPDLVLFMGSVRDL